MTYFLTLFLFFSYSFCGFSQFMEKCPRQKPRAFRQAKNEGVFGVSG